MTGFCPKGSNCSFAHPKFELPTSNAVLDAIALDTEEAQRQAEYQQQAAKAMYPGANGGAGGGFQKRDFSHITCHKCGEKGHYANVCPNGPAVKRFKTE